MRQTFYHKEEQCEYKQGEFVNERLKQGIMLTTLKVNGHRVVSGYEGMFSEAGVADDRAGLLCQYTALRNQIIAFFDVGPAQTYQVWYVILGLRVFKFDK